MKILHFNTQGGGVGDYRNWIPAKALERRGHEVWFAEGSDIAMPWEGPGSYDAFLFEKMSWADVVHLGFGGTAALYEQWVAAREYARRVLQRQVPLILDCDDDILHVPEYNSAFRQYGATKEALQDNLIGIRVADAVAVTTPWLQDVYSPYNDHIYKLPNSLALQDWEGLPRDPARADSADVRIIFAGGIGRKNDVDSIREALERVMRLRPQVRLFFMAMMPDWVAAEWATSATDPSANRAFFINFCGPQTYRRIMTWLGFDICIAPVVPNDFNRGKSDIKVMESAMYGAASVCSDWDTYAEVPAEAALKCSTVYEWTESLLALVDDPALRASKVAACRDWVLTCRNIDTNIHLWEECYRDVCSRPVIDDAGTGIKPVQRVTPPTAMEVAFYADHRGRSDGPGQT